MVHERCRRNGFLLLNRLSNVGIASAAAVLVPYLISPAAASPLTFGGTTGSLESLEVRDDDGGPSSDIQIWVPIIVIALIVLSTVAIYSYRKAKAARAANNRTTNPATNPPTREITAEQLAGTINNGAQAQANGNAGATRTRRARRPRRTPSQVSTRSLPVYAKEPGEQEVVIARGTEDMEDATMPAATVMSSVSEDGEDSLHSRANSQASRYPPLPTTPNDQPLLLQEDDDQEHDQNHSYPPRREHAEHRQSTQSYDTSNASDETSSLMRAESRPVPEDPRGPTPAYFEAVESPFDDNQASRSPMQNAEMGSPPASPEAQQATITQRRSGFRNLIGSLPNRLSMATSHTRGPSTLSAASTDQSHGRETSQSRASHRTNPSGSSSFANLSPFRTRSRQQSIPNMQNLTSPSLISLASISSPLTHTATRTEFTYPKAGPTPEQLKLISSRESFGRFGVPYGPDAVAFAASQERVNLSVPPPDFETASTSPNLGSPSLSSLHSPAIGGTSSPTPGPSRLRSTTRADTQDANDVLDRPVEAHSDLMDAHALAASDAMADTPQSVAMAPSTAVNTSSETPGAMDGVLSPSLARSPEAAPKAVSLDEPANPAPRSKDAVEIREPATIPLPSSPATSPKAEPVVLPMDDPEDKRDAHLFTKPEDEDGDVSDDGKDDEDADDSEDEKDIRKRDTIMVAPKYDVEESDSEDEKDTSKRDTIMVPKHALAPLSIPAPPQAQNQDLPPTKATAPPSSYVPPQPKPSAAPPSAFRSPDVFQRSESRASSVRSYATAAESMHTPSTAYHTDYSSDDDENYVSGRETPADMYESAYDDDGDDDEAETPTTPKMQSAGLPLDHERTPQHVRDREHGNGHALEASDATVRGPTAGVSAQS